MIKKIEEFFKSEWQAAFFIPLCAYVIYIGSYLIHSTIKEMNSEMVTWIHPLFFLGF